MEYEKCYVFEPSDRRPAKRRKIEPQGLQKSWKTRHGAYQKAWKDQKRRIDDSLNAINSTTIQRLEQFLEDATTGHDDGRIPTAIISAGPNAAAHQGIVQQLKQNAITEGRRVFVSLSAGAATNLKAALKFIILKATSQTEDADDEDAIQTQSKGPKLLNYDLQILANYARDRNLERVVLSIEDTEAFNSEILSELIEILACWHDRIPFVLLLNVATSLDFLEQRISAAAVQSLRGEVFDVAPAAEEIERVAEVLATSDASIWIGPNLMTMILERQSDYVQSVDSLVHAIQFAYMSSYYANALSIFLDTDSKTSVPSDHFNAARNVPSFRKHCRRLLDGGEYKSVQTLLDSDDALCDLVVESVATGRQALSGLTSATKVVRKLQRCLQGEQAATFSRLHVQAMSGKLHQSGPIRAMLLSIRKAPSNQAIQLMESFVACEAPQDTRDQCGNILHELRELLEKQTHTAQPLRSEDDVKNSTLRTTVVAQRVELSKQKSALSKEDAAYTVLLRRFTDLLEEYFEASLITPKELTFHEIFLYDLKSPHREVFTPRPRHAIERALAAPHDYLTCDCCAPRQGEGDDATLASTQPATAIVYQLYLESGGLINASDLWQAFRAVVGDEREEQESMALFQRGLAELRHLGMVKSTRKRVDHIAKIAWRGL